MTKLEFLYKLEQKLSALPKENVHERLNFYSEMIDDLVEEGLCEEEAVKKLGSIEDIAAQIIADSQGTYNTKTKQSKKALSAGKIVFIALCAPVWLPILIAAIAVCLAVYICIWAVIISLWAVFGSLVACAVAAIPAGIFFAIDGYIPSAVATVGASLVCAGLAVFFFYGSKKITKGVVWLTKKTSLFIKNKFTKREAEQ